MPNRQKKCENCLSGCGSSLGGGEIRRGSRKERLRTGQVTDKLRSTNVSETNFNGQNEYLPYKKRTKCSLNDHRMHMRLSSGELENVSCS